MSLSPLRPATIGIGMPWDKSCSAPKESDFIRNKALRHAVYVVNIPAGTIHWHGAAPDSRFTHIGITPEASRNQVEWLGEVTDEEYNRATE